MTSRAYVFVTAALNAFHTDPILGEGRHMHTWRVTAYYNARPFRDGRALSASLLTILGVWQDRDLPPALWAVEDLAAAILQLNGNGDCIGVRIERADGMAGAEVWA